MIKELLDVLSLTEVVYKNNWSKESNYCYFDEQNMWTSNTSSEGVGDDETLIFHTFSTPLPFSNCGIPSAKFHAILKTLSPTATIKQNSDHLLILDGKKKVKLPTVKYVDPPKVDLCELNYSLLTELHDNAKNITQYVEKTDTDGNRVHFIDGNVYTTDINSFHRTYSPIDENFAVPLFTFNSMYNFEEYCIDDYFYLKKGETIAVTRYYDPVDISFLLSVSKDREIHLSDIMDAELFKIFNADTKKPDREVKVDIIDGVIRIESGNENSGYISVEGETDTAFNVSFTCNADKFELYCKKANEVYLDGEILIGVFDDYEKFIAVEVE